jgi:hypothetical protein
VVIVEPGRVIDDVAPETTRPPLELPELAEQLYRYELTRPCAGGDAWWKRTLAGVWLPLLSTDDPRLQRFLTAHGWN